VRDDDQRPFEPAPDEYVSPFARDATNQTTFRPISRFFVIDPAGRALNVNAYDEEAALARILKNASHRDSS